MLRAAAAAGALLLARPFRLGGSAGAGVPASSPVGAILFLREYFLLGLGCCSSGSFTLVTSGGAGVLRAEPAAHTAPPDLHKVEIIDLRACGKHMTLLELMWHGACIWLESASADGVHELT